MWVNINNINDLKSGDTILCKCTDGKMREGIFTPEYTWRNNPSHRYSENQESQRGTILERHLPSSSGDDVHINNVKVWRSNNES